MSEPTNLLQITDAMLRNWANDPRFRQLLPCLDVLNQPVSGKSCFTCPSKKRAAEREAMQSARSCIAALRGDRLATLKSLVNARQIRVVARSAGGGIVTYTLR